MRGPFSSFIIAVSCSYCLWTDSASVFSYVRAFPSYWDIISFHSSEQRLYFSRLRHCDFIIRFMLRAAFHPRLSFQARHTFSFLLLFLFSHFSDTLPTVSLRLAELLSFSFISYLLFYHSLQIIFISLIFFIFFAFFFSFFDRFDFIIDDTFIFFFLFIFSSIFSFAGFFLLFQRRYFQRCCAFRHHSRCRGLIFARRAGALRQIALSLRAADFASVSLTFLLSDWCFLDIFIRWFRFLFALLTEIFSFFVR